MRLLVFMLAVSIVSCSSSIGDLNGQTESREFIESSSPHSDGGRVISRSVPGRGIQTVITVSNNNSGSRAGSRQTEPTLARESALRQSNADSNSGVASQITRSQSYPYPAGNRMSQSVLFPPVRAKADRTQSIPYQIPTLGLSNPTTTRRAKTYSKCCGRQGYGVGTALQVPAYQAPLIQVQPPANQIPSLSVQNPNQGGQFGASGVQSAPYSNVPQQQFASRQNSFLSPFVSGSGAYQPIIRLANVRPGTYVGQGIIGQPTAFVDGQPVRNLVRYIFP